MKFLNKYSTQWIENGIAVLTSTDISKEFYDFIETLPWNYIDGRIDWNVLGNIKIDLKNLEENEIIDRIKSSVIGQYERVVFWYDVSEPALSCRADVAFANFDVAFWNAPGRRYMFGANSFGKELICYYQDFAEFDGADTIIFPR